MTILTYFSSYKVVLGKSSTYKRGIAAFTKIGAGDYHSSRFIDGGATRAFVSVNSVLAGEGLEARMTQAFQHKKLSE